MAVAVAFWIWYAAIAAKLAVCVLCAVRRIPAPIFFLFFAAHSARSLYLLTLQNNPDAYHAFRTASAPYLDVAAGLVAVEAALLLCWRMPRFRWMAAAITGVAGAVAALAAAGGGYAWQWDSQTAYAAAAAWDRTTGLLLAGWLLVWVLVMDKFKDADRGALYHVAALALMALASSLSAILAMRQDSGMWGSWVSSGGALLAYGVWIATVRGIDLTRQQPGPPIDRGDVERAWGQSA